MYNEINIISSDAEAIFAAVSVCTMAGERLDETEG